jgi:hypothetical protein
MAPPPIRVAFVSHHPHLRMGGQRSMALLIEHLDRRVVEPLAICPGPGAHRPPPRPRLPRRTSPAPHQAAHPARRLEIEPTDRVVLRERAVDIIAPDAPRDTLTCGLGKLGTQPRWSGSCG